jgi:hypothetical protein
MGHTIWVTHMKTTLDIADPILRQARSLAARRNTTLRAVVEQALRDALARERQASNLPKVQTKTFGGNGLQAGLSWDDWGAIRDLAYEGRGS